MEKEDYEYCLDAVGEGFTAKEKEKFLNREAVDKIVVFKKGKYEGECRGRADVPLPIDYPIERHIQWTKIIESYEKGVIFYKNRFEFLESPENWELIEPDVSIMPSTILYKCGNCYFMGRGLIDLRDGKFFKELQELAQREFKHLKFEEPLGLFAPDEGELVLYHTYSGGLTLNKIERLSKEMIQKTIKVLAKAMKELYRNHIIYIQTIPTNMRYDLGKKIFFNPHSYINISEEDDDIGNLLYTHDYIKDGREFLRYYFGESRKIGIRDFEIYRKWLIDYMDNWYLAKGLGELSGMWRQRGNIGFQKLG